MKFKSVVIIAVLSGAHGLASSGAAQEGHRHYGEPSNSSRSQFRPKSIVIELIKEIGQASDAIKSAGQDANFGEPPAPKLPTIPGSDPWTVLQVTQLDDPMTSDECRRQAVKNAELAIGSQEMAMGHAGKHFEEWKEVLQDKRKISISQYLDHISHCTEFCAPLVGSLLKCHIDGARLARSIVINFEVGEPQASTYFSFASSEKEQIASFVREARSEGGRILVEARASILGERETLPYNLALSERRASVVRSALVDAGFPLERILVKSLAWEPPRLAIQEIAEAYGFSAVRARFRNPQYMDQSVVLLVYGKRGN